MVFKLFDKKTGLDPTVNTNIELKNYKLLKTLKKGSICQDQR